MKSGITRKATNCFSEKKQIIKKGGSNGAMDKIVVNSSTKYTVLEELNSEFTLVKIRVMALGKNRNMSYFSRDIVKAHLNSLNYVPVVAHLFKDENGNYRIGGHDCYIDEDWQIKSLCVPFGVVKADTFDWETVDEYGTEVEYLVCEAILWTGRYPELMETIYAEDVWWNQSMEIDCRQYRRLEEDSNYVEILDFEFSALCLLYKSDDREENIEPCFISADVRPMNYSADEFASQMNEMKIAMQEIFSYEKEEGENMDETMNLNQSLNEGENFNADNAQQTSDEPAEDYIALYNNSLAEIQTLNEKISELESTIADYTAQIESLTPYKVAAEMAEREKAEGEIFAKYDEYIGDMPEYVTLKEKSAEYDLEQLDKECVRLVGISAMRSFSLTKKTKKADQEPMLKFGFESNTTNTSRYGDIFERYGNNE